MEFTGSLLFLYGDTTIGKLPCAAITSALTHLNLSTVTRGRFRKFGSATLQRGKLNIQGDSGGKVNNLGGDSVGNCEKKIHIHMYLILNGYPNGAV